ncbi:histidine phosphatase family protein [Rivihabitans pingtungensis]|jgi:alpha-ribazole phosphatase/probable phosphoglycerate mutase|uniref:histidine phosphatase family protein n=1 Tax=Rivihabitans pingtungensis TaxID=1054498 RepID=UPI00289B0B9E|nr:histidine phosphatase family protein [Rivihabitans pingtungensis]
MKPFTVTLLRHGDTPLSGRLIGQRSDPPPTAAAQVQLAATLAQLHARQPITRLAASPLLRCRAPAEAFAARHNVALTLDADLAEIDFGDWDAADPLTLPADWSARCQDPAGGPPGGERIVDFRGRCARAWARHCAGLGEQDGEHLLLLSHGGVISALLAEAMAMPWPLARRVAVARGGWLRLSCYPPEPAWLLALEGADA